ncbi:hypothetical protein TNCV_1341261 [Trichonephila clavipes]|uniref:Uncharacterized protein n=1 Tax=Trichonephila clavipes TaxID=2585209 RepID=A0A8X6RVS0_TRICX|nr:hypothetical protein TNCV_1341261 [Trichonephila clavipes]
MSSFQTSPDSECSILISVYASGGSEETTLRLLAFEISIGSLSLVQCACAISSGLPNFIFTQDNARPYVACRILTSLDTQGMSGIFDCYPGQLSHQICPLLKTSGYELLRTG